MKRLVTVLACAGVAMTLATAASATTLEDVKKRGTLNCGANGQLPGFGLPDSQGNWTGLDVDLCRAIADRDDPGRTAVMRRHLAAIGDRRLRQTTAAAIDLEGARQTRLSEARFAGRNGWSKAAAPASRSLGTT